MNATRKMMVYVKLEEAQEKTLFSPSFSDGKSHRNTMKSSSFVIFALLSPCCGLGRKEKSSDLRGIQRLKWGWTGFRSKENVRTE